MTFTSFHETNGGSKEELREAISVAGYQDKLVLAFFKQNEGKSFSAEQIHSLANHNWLLSSARRSCSNLLKAGLIKKNSKDERVMGQYGMRIYTYTLKK